MINKLFGLQKYSSRNYSENNNFWNEEQMYRKKYLLTYIIIKNMRRKKGEI